jgi:hypothetical protein
MKKYKLKNALPEGKLVWPDKAYDLSRLTDEDAEEILTKPGGDHYIEKQTGTPEPKKGKESNKSSE